MQVGNRWKDDISFRGQKEFYSSKIESLWFFIFSSPNYGEKLSFILMQSHPSNLQWHVVSSPTPHIHLPLFPFTWNLNISTNVIPLFGEGPIISWVGVKRWWNIQFSLVTLFLEQLNILSKTSTCFWRIWVWFRCTIWRYHYLNGI